MAVIRGSIKSDGMMADPDGGGEKVNGIGIGTRDEGAVE